MSTVYRGLAASYRLEGARETLLDLLAHIILVPITLAMFFIFIAAVVLASPILLIDWAWRRLDR